MQIVSHRRVESQKCAVSDSLQNRSSIVQCVARRERVKNLFLRNFILVLFVIQF